jgi:hypothetical protein
MLCPKHDVQCFRFLLGNVGSKSAGTSNKAAGLSCSTYFSKLAIAVTVGKTGISAIHELEVTSIVECALPILSGNSPGGSARASESRGWKNCLGRPSDSRLKISSTERGNSLLAKIVPRKDFCFTSTDSLGCKSGVGEVYKILIGGHVEYMYSVSRLPVTQTVDNQTED